MLMSYSRWQLIRSDLHVRKMSLHRSWQLTSQRISRLRLVPWLFLALVIVVVGVPFVREWADSHEGAMTAAAALVAASFAWFTLDLVSQGRETVYLNKEQVTTQFAPIIVIELEPGGTMHEFFLTVSNFGAGVALNLRFEHRPPLTVIEGMSEPLSIPPMPFYIDPGHFRPIMALRRGDSLKVKLTPAERFFGSRLWEDFWENPLVKSGGSVSLGYFNALYEHINQTEWMSSVTIDWDKNDDELSLWGMAIQSPDIRPRPLPVVDTDYWRTFPRYWFRKTDGY